MCLLLIGLLILTSCVAPIIPQLPDPYPYSFTDTSKELYPKTTNGAQRFIADARDLWRFEDNSIVMDPEFSATYFRGDCDDFAVMMAYYLQEYWKYDTFIVFLRDLYYPYVADHAVAFVYFTDGLIKFTYCANDPVVELQERYMYYPVDWEYCPDWQWAKFGGTKDYHPGGWTYSYDLHDAMWISTGGFLEWYEMVHLTLSTFPPEGILDPRQNTAKGPAAMGRP
ncbi:MAG TPA: hypothetical protein VMX15_01180, partial [Candidatus Heimdallarchaeota archaeon]|nr:hypothetical protein [Candidatus Heimdallarchaeota archaeon]